jgi:hypothetical protein
MGGPRTGVAPGGRRGRRKKGLWATFQDEIGEEIEALVGRQALAGLDLEALENGARRAALHLVARMLEQRLNADHSDEQEPQRCGCQQAARYAGRKAKTFQSVLGPLTLERAYYHCSACQRGFYPRDRDWGLEGGSLTPGVVRMVAAVGAAVSFEEGRQFLEELSGVAVDAKQIERTAEALGRQVADDERQQTGPLSAAAPAPTLYLGVDGTGVPMRAEEVVGRAGKQADGSAKTREVKLCVVWSAESRDRQGRPVRDPGSVSYSAAIESAAALETAAAGSEFYQRVARETARRGFLRAQRRVVLGDGAPWIWNLAQELYPDAIQIVDRWHVKEHLSQVSHSLYGFASSRARAWMRRRFQELDSGRFDALLRAVARHAPRREDARKLLGYLKANRSRMDYPRFEALGLCTSSGVVEAGCKVAIGTRLKRAGMRWSLPGANAIIALRCCRLSGRFQDFWERRAELKRVA